MDEVSLLQAASAFLLNLGFAWLLGSWCARYWIQSNGGSRGDVEPVLRKLDLCAAGLGAAGSAAAMLAATEVMGGVGLREACPMLWMMISSTDYGHAGCVTTAAMIILFIIRWSGGATRASDMAVALALLAFAVTRASMGHAGEEGFWSMPLLAEAVHFSAIGLWSGAVLVSAWFALNDTRIAAFGIGAADRYLDLMSQAALAAVAGIAVTGMYSAWHRVGTADHLLHTVYGMTLLAKAALVLAALLLGGYNKFIGLPAASRSQRGLRLVRTALRIESFLLLGAVLAASILISQQPPTAM
ncbi:copper resistance D family protein [Janthinobacterium agaricidamnosum]|uniref:Copper resistance D family protein n=1 Tax=Janthinobacterium agaricidamnosum NBRC 102515 = DSM 9628 TaxID=1349767 RepID=W0V4Q3_9BURK|nr:CopD family protein [Janthinobacterium agaricidamnosum]CDG83809.1 copper resistance D family protein [Janthinobacterium agaricidamnosum NBRC 102515 = DSM 9628]